MVDQTVVMMIVLSYLEFFFSPPYAYMLGRAYFVCKRECSCSIGSSRKWKVIPMIRTHEGEYLLK